MPSPPPAGVFGMARTTGFSVASSDCRRSEPTPARIDISSVSRRNPALRSVASTTGASFGLTHSRIRSAEGGYVVQGKVLDAETRAQLRDLGGDEDGVFVPDNVIDRIRGPTRRLANIP